MGNKLERELFRYDRDIYRDRYPPIMPKIPPQPAPGMAAIMCCNGMEHCQRIKWVLVEQAGIKWNCKSEHEDAEEEIFCCCWWN